MDIQFKPKKISGKIFILLFRLLPYYSSKIIFTRLICIFFFKKGITLVDNKSGISINVTLNDYITGELLLHGIYEKKTINLSMKIMEKGGVFIDVGASFGLFTCLISSNPSTSTIAIEPYFNAFHLLLNNISSNHLQNVIPINSAISTKKLLKFKKPKAGNIGTGKTIVLENMDNTDSYFLSATTITEILQTFGIKSIDLMKIDVEGAEMEVLNSFDYQYGIKPHNIILEYEKQHNPYLENIFYFLQKHFYKAYTIEGEFLENPPSLPLPESNIHFILTTK